MNNLISADIRMTSQDISELVESEHHNVRRSIERLSKRGIIETPPTDKVSTGQRGPKTEVYVFDYEHKRDSFVVVAQLSPVFTAKMVDRWQELEERLKKTPQQVLDAYWKKFRRGAASHYNKLMDEIDDYFDRNNKEKVTSLERRGRLNSMRANEANFLNRLVLGMESQEFRYWFNVFGEPIRDSFPAVMLSAMERAEQTDAMLIRRDMKRAERESFIRTMLEIEFPDVVNYRELALAEKKRLEDEGYENENEKRIAPPNQYRELQAEATLLEHLNVQDVVMLSLNDATAEMRSKQLEESLRMMWGAS